MNRYVLTRSGAGLPWKLLFWLVLPLAIAVALIAGYVTGHAVRGGRAAAEQARTAAEMRAGRTQAQSWRDKAEGADTQVAALSQELRRAETQRDGTRVQYERAQDQIAALSLAVKGLVTEPEQRDPKASLPPALRQWAEGKTQEQLAQSAAELTRKLVAIEQAVALLERAGYQEKAAEKKAERDEMALRLRVARLYLEGAEAGGRPSQGQTGVGRMAALPLSAQFWQAYEFTDARQWRNHPGALDVSQWGSDLSIVCRGDSARPRACVHDRDIAGGFVVTAVVRYHPADRSQCKLGLLNRNTNAAVYLSVQPGQWHTVQLARKGGKLAGLLDGREVFLAKDDEGGEDMAGQFMIGLLKGDRLDVKCLSIQAE